MNSATPKPKSAAKAQAGAGWRAKAVTPLTSPEGQGGKKNTGENGRSSRPAPPQMRAIFNCHKQPGPSPTSVLRKKAGKEQDGG